MHWEEFKEAVQDKLEELINKKQETMLEILEELDESDFIELNQSTAEEQAEILMREG